MANTVCTSCKRLITNVTGTVQFQCPSCDQHTLVRCSHCRTLAAKYHCPGCNFEGPN